MAHFYGRIQGNRGEATRMGSRASGFQAYAASWEGRVSTRLWHNEERGEDWCEVSLERHHGAGSSHLLYRGPVALYQPNGQAPEPQREEVPA